MFYLRLVGKPKEIYQVLEKLLVDSRKIIIRTIDGSFETSFIDELADKLLTESILYDIVLPRLTHRDLLEEEGKLKPRVSPLEKLLEEMEEKGELNTPSVMSMVINDKSIVENEGEALENEKLEKKKKDKKKRKKEKKERKGSRSRSRDRTKKKMKKRLKKMKKKREREK